MPPASAIARWLRRRWIWLAGGLVALGLLGIAGGALFAWSGLYNVAASTGHWAVVEDFLRFAMRNSVQARAPDEAPPLLDDPDRIRLGAAHFHSGCAFCHGAPGVPMSLVTQQMVPSPPDLGNRVGLWSDGELFWIVKHGIKYAGMPAWVAQDRDDEVWSLVAFLRRLPALDADSYLPLAQGEVRIEPASGRGLAIEGSGGDAVEACARCHGAGDRPPLSRLVPRLHGQPAAMLRRALDEYATGQRSSGIMQPVAAGLSPRAMGRLADYYSGLAALPPRAPAPEPTIEPPIEDAARIDAGRRLARDGDAAAGVPPCLACHGPQAIQTYPRLAGQPAPYVAGQLRNWRRGAHDRTAGGAIMAPIARRLSERQVDEVAAFFESLRPGEAQAP